ncbi:MAG: hypothetical protein AB7O92_00330 [Acidimicrobiia bacterium]
MVRALACLLTCLPALAVCAASPAGADGPDVTVGQPVPVVDAAQPGEGPLAVTISPDRATVPYFGKATFDVTITNTATTGVGLFRIDMPACSLWEEGPLRPGATIALRCEMGPFDQSNRQYEVSVSATDFWSRFLVRRTVAINVGPPTSSVALQQYLDGVDPGAPEVPNAHPLGTALRLTAVVTNTGPDRLHDIAVADNELGAIPCPQSALEPGASMVCGPSRVAIDRVDVVIEITAVTAYGTDGAPVGAGDALRWRGLDPTPPCPAAPDLLRGVTVQVDAGPITDRLAGLRVLSGNNVIVRWSAMAPGAEGCRISLAQYDTPWRTFRPDVEQHLIAAASCAGAGCRSADGVGYELRLSARGMDRPAQFDLVTGTPLAGVGPSSGYYSAWLSGGTHRLIMAGTSVEATAPR